MKIRIGQGKWALRQVLYRHVPRETIERPKAGFAVPILQWLHRQRATCAETMLAEKRLREEGYLDAAPIRRILQEHPMERREWTTRLWGVLMFQAWLERTGPASAMHGPIEAVRV